MSAPLRILHLDDSRTDRELVRDALLGGQSGFLVTEADSRAAFEARLSSGGYDLVLSDFHLPGFTALEVIDMVKAANEDLPVVIVTGTGSEAVAVEAMKRGAADYLVKSAETFRTLPAAIRAVVNTDRRRGERRNPSRMDVDFRSTFDSAQIGIAHISLGGCFIRANPKLCEMLGYDEAELQGENFDRFTHPDDRGPSHDKFEALVRGEVASAQFSKRYRRNDGRTIWAELSIAAVRNSSGAISHLVTVLQEVTERRQVAELLSLEHSVARTLTEADDRPHALQAVLQATCASQGWEFGRFWRLDSAAGVLRADTHWSVPDALIDRFVQASQARTFAPGEGMLGIALKSSRPIFVPDLREDGRLRQPDFAHQAGLRAAILVPVTSRSGIHGVLAFASRDIREPNARLIGATESIGRQLGQFLERNRVETTLRRFRVALDNSADMILLIDRATMRYVDVNDTVCRLLGYSREELTSMGPQDVLPESREQLERAYDELFADPSIKGGAKSHYRCKDGTTLPFESTRHVLRSEGGFLISAISRDISQRVAAEQTLRESESRFRSLVGLSSDFYWETDAEHRMTVRSPGAAAKSLEAFGGPALLGKRRWELPYLTPSSEGWKEHQAVLDARRPFQGFEFSRRAPDGTVFHFSVSGEPTFGAQGEFTGYRGVGTDITARKSGEAALRESERFAKMTLDALKKHICVLDEHGALVAVNRAWREFAHDHHPMPEKVLTGSNYLAACDAAAEPEAALFAQGARAVLAGARAEFEMEYACHAPREQRWFHVRVTRFPDAGPIRAVVAHDNITARVLAEHATRRHAKQQGLMASFGQLALAAPEIDTLHDQAVTFCSYGLDVDLCSLLQLAADGRSLLFRAGRGWDEGWVGRDLGNAGPETQDSYVLESLQPVTVDDFAGDMRFRPAAMLAAHGVASGVEVPILGSSGPYGLLGAFSREKRSFTQEDTDFLQGIANTLDIAIARKVAEEKLAYLAQFDTLTDLPNRLLFRDRLAQTLSMAERHGRVTGVLYVDLDGFKTVNDTLGHPAGDLLLRKTGDRIRECVRAGDTVSRLAGDEFGVVLSNLSKGDDARLVAQKVLAACARAFDLEGPQVQISASIGIALSPDDGTDPDALIKSADIAMYRAKEKGRNDYQFFLPEMHQRVIDRMQVERELRLALERHEFVLHFQPKADLYSGAISGFEALLRWQHPVRGLVAPLEFIPVLEDTGLIIPVGEWIVRTVCAQLVAWRDQGLRPLPVAINLSARQFQQKGLDFVIGSILAETGADPRMLELELTESMLMKDAEETVGVLRNLKACGVCLSVDDFGTGYSSLAYLKRFPLDSLKIDRAFIRECTTQADDAIIALSIINLAHSLKLKVIAEGVETEAQLNFLRSRGCDQMQGYLFSRPLDRDAATQALGRNMRLPATATEDGEAAVSILLVDDNELDLELFRDALAADGYRILTARNPQIALETMAAHKVRIVISDQSMPAMSGVAFLAAVRRLHPDAIRVMLTGSDSPATLPAAVNEAGIHGFLSKHWESDRLCAAVREVWKLALQRSASDD